MGIYFDFPSGWWVVLAIIYGAYFLAFLGRKKRRRGEVKSQIVLGFIVLLLAFLVEFAGVSLRVWTYIPNNWPVILWVGYFGVGLAGYQISKLVEERNKK